jgi:prepilin-type N-terminal cleavage/methylation domain-containing protein
MTFVKPVSRASLSPSTRLACVGACVRGRDAHGRDGHRRGAHRRVRGFSLIEVMTVVVILGLIAVMAVPTFEPVTRRQKVDGALDSVSAFVGRARALAITSGRCVRVRLQTTLPARLVAESLNIYDCLDSTSDPVPTPRIDGTAPNAANLWKTAFEMRLEEKGIEVSFNDGANNYFPIVTYPHAGWNVPGPVANAALIYRPTGRLWSDHNPTPVSGNPADIYAEDGVLVVRAASEPTEMAYLIAASHGPICSVKMGRPLVIMAPGDYQCP